MCQSKNSSHTIPSGKGVQIIFFLWLAHLGGWRSPFIYSASHNNLSFFASDSQNVHSYKSLIQDAGRRQQPEAATSKIHLTVALAEDWSIHNWKPTIAHQSYLISKRNKKIVHPGIKSPCQPCDSDVIINHWRGLIVYAVKNVQVYLTVVATVSWMCHNNDKQELLSMQLICLVYKSSC